MKLIIYKNHFPIKVKSPDNKTKVFKINPGLPVKNLIFHFAKKLNIKYYLGYTISLINKQQIQYLDENLPVCVQNPKFSRFSFGINYYFIMDKDTENSTSLERTYSLTRDFVISGLSELQPENYILLCAQISIIENYSKIETIINSNDSALLLQYLPERLQSDLNSEEDLFDEVKSFKIEELQQMKINFINSARSFPTFGSHSFYVKYSNSQTLPYIYLCIDYKGIILVQKSNLTVIKRFEYNDFSLKIKENKLIINESDELIVENPNRIKQLIDGYCYLNSILKDHLVNEQNLEELIYHQNKTTDDIELEQLIPVKFNIEDAISYQTFTFMNDKIFLNSDELKICGNTDLNAIKQLQFVISNDLKFTKDFDYDYDDLMNDALKLESTLKNINFKYSLFELNENYGNELRSALFFISLIEEKDENLFKNLSKIYKEIKIKIESKIIGFHYKKLCPPRNMNIKEHLKNVLQTIPNIIKLIDEANNQNNEFQSKTYNELTELLKTITTILTNIPEENDEITFVKYKKKFYEFKNDLINLIPIIAFFDLLNSTKISGLLSTIYDDLESSLIYLTSFMIPKTNVSDVFIGIQTIIEKSIRLYNKNSEQNSSKFFVFLSEMIPILQSKIPNWDTRYIKRTFLQSVDDILLQYQDYIHENDFLLKNLILLTRYFLKNVPKSSIYENQKDLSTLKEPKEPRRKVRGFKINDEIIKDDEIEISLNDINSLNLDEFNPSKSSSDSIFNEFIQDFNEISPITLKNIYLFLVKWKPKLIKINVEPSSFKYIKSIYDSCLKLLKFNAERQEQFQTPFMLIKKALFHANNISSDKNELKDFLTDLQNHFSDITLIRNSAKIEKFLNNLKEIEDKSISVLSLCNIFTKLLEYISLFSKHSNYNSLDILNELKVIQNNAKEIYRVILEAQCNESSTKIIKTLSERILELSEIYLIISKTTLDEILAQSIIKQLTKMLHGLEGLSVILLDHHLYNKAGNLLISISRCIWKLQHCIYEDHKHNRLMILIQNSTTKINDLAHDLTDKDSEHDLVNSLFFISKEISKNQDPNRLIHFCDGFYQLYYKYKQIDVRYQFMDIINSIELIVSRLLSKPYKYFPQNISNLMNFTINSYDDNNLFSGSSRSLRSIGFSDSSDDEHNEEIIRKKSLTSRYQSDEVQIDLYPIQSQIEKIRPSILLDPKNTVNRKPNGPHVTFDLSKDRNAPIFSTSTSLFVDEAPPELLPHSVPSIYRNSWNVQLFSRTFKVPDYTNKNKRNSTSKLRRKYMNLEKSFDLLLIPENINVKNNSIYSSKDKAEEDINIIKTQIEELENKFDNLHSFTEKVFLIVDNLPLLNDICLRNQSLKSFNIMTINELYNSIRNKLNTFVKNIIVTNNYIYPYENLKNIDVLIDLLLIALEKAKSYSLSCNQEIQDIIRSSLYSKEAKKSIQSLINTEDHLLVLFVNDYIKILLNNYLIFGKYTEQLDSNAHNKINIISIIQTQICNQLNIIYRFIKKLNLQKNAPISKITNIISSIKSNEISELLEKINNFLHEKNMQYSQADKYSVELKLFSKTIYKTNQKLFCLICQLNYYLLSINFIPPNHEELLTQLIKNSIKNIVQIIQEIKQNSSKLDTNFSHTICNAWSKFLADVNGNMTNLQFVASVAINTKSRCDQLLSYLKNISKEICILEDSAFPFSPLSKYSLLVIDLEKAIDYLSSTNQEKKIEVEEIELPNIEIKKIKKKIIIEKIIYIENHKLILKNIKKVNNENIKNINLYKLFKQQIKFFGREIQNSLKVNHHVILMICNQMISVLQNIDNEKLKKIVQNQIKILSTTIRNQNNYLICKKDKEITQKLNLFLNFLAQITLFNLYFITNQENNFNELKLHYDQIKDFINFDIQKFENIEKIEIEIELFESIINSINQNIIKPQNSFGLNQSQITMLNELKFEDVTPKYIKYDKLFNYIQPMKNYFYSIFWESSKTFIKMYKYFIDVINTFSNCISYLNINFLNLKMKSIKDLYLKLNKLLDNPIEFNSLYFEIVEIFEKIHNNIEIIKPIIEAETEKQKFIEAFELLKSIKQQLNPLKNRSIYENIAFYLKRLKHSSMLKLRTSMSPYELTDFLLYIKQLIDAQETDRIHINTMKKLYNCILPGFPESKKIKQQISVYLQKSS